MVRTLPEAEIRGHLKGGISRWASILGKGEKGGGKGRMQGTEMVQEGTLKRKTKKKIMLTGQKGES